MNPYFLFMFLLEIPILIVQLFIARLRILKLSFQVRIFRTKNRSLALKIGNLGIRQSKLLAEIRKDGESSALYKLPPRSRVNSNLTEQALRHPV